MNLLLTLCLSPRLIDDGWVGRTALLGRRHGLLHHAAPVQHPVMLLLLRLLRLLRLSRVLFRQRQGEELDGLLLLLRDEVGQLLQLDRVQLKPLRPATAQ